jgi:hypothetical protein
MIRGSHEQACVVQWGAHHYSQREIFSEVKGNFFGYFGDIFEKSLFEALRRTGKTES